MIKPLAFLITAATASAAALPVTDLKRSTPVDFAKEVFPVLKQNCLACHNATKAKSGLNLETPELILKGGDNGPAAVPGRSAESLLLKNAAHAEDPVMPPPGNKVNAVDLTGDQLGLLKLWIDQGAKGTAPGQEAGIVWRGFPGGAAAVGAVAVSPGGTVAAAARGSAVTLFDVSTGLPLGNLSDPALAKLDLYRNHPVADRDAVMAMAFGADDLLATGGYRTVRLWRRAAFLTKTENAALPETPLCLASSGTWAAAGDAAGHVWFWNTAVDKPQAAELKDHTSPVKALAISPDAQLIVSTAEDRSVRVWSVTEKKAVFRAESPVPLMALRFLKNGTLLAAAGNDGMLRIYPFPKEVPPETPKPSGEYRLADKAPAFFTALDAAGTQVLWGSGDAVLHVFDAATGKPVRDVTCEHPAARHIAETARRVQSAQRQADVRKSRATAAADSAGKESEAVKTSNTEMEKTRAAWQRKQEEASAAAAALRAMPEDKGRIDAAAKVTKEAAAAERAFTNARTNAELSVRLAGQSLQAKVAAEAALAAALSSLAESQADQETAKKAAAAPFPAVKSAVALNGGKSVLLQLEGSRVQWHSLENGVLSDATESAALPLLVSAGDQLLAVRPDKKSVLLPPQRPWVLERTIGGADDTSTFSGRVTSLSFSSGGRLLATGGGIPSRSGEVKIWNVSDGASVLTLKDPHSDTVNALAFSPDDSLLATAGSDRWARVFRVSDGQRTASFEGHSSHVLSIAWRCDGLALATGGADNTLRVWDLLDAKQIRNTTSFSREVSAVSWIGTGDTIASASGDSTVRLNDDRLPGAKGFVFCLATDSSGKYLAAGGDDGVLRLWDASGKKLLREHTAK
ncbi:MAG TPA: c-type cytochrome domain-containing protein [Verrucomicrobiales bacterium]|nr:c-type cytochrome domain-containing protein [Verrucomicrobiales bacterium]